MASVGNVLLVGGNGYLGWSALEHLLPLAECVHVLDLPGSRPLDRRAFPGVQQYEGSVTDRVAIDEAVAAADPDVVIVLASHGGGGLGLLKAAEADPVGAVSVNVNGLVNVLEVAKAHRKARLLWLSSTTVYGPAESYSEPVDEASLVAPRSIYAATKVLGEQLVRSYRQSYGLVATAVRPTLVWGPGIRYDGVQSGLNMLVEGAVKDVQVSVRDSPEVWDLLYVRDAGRALAWLAAHEDLGPTVLVNGYQASVRDVRHALLRQFDNARLHLTEDATALNVPLVDDGLVRRAGFAPQYDLEGSIADYSAQLFDQAAAASEITAGLADGED